MKCMQCGHFIAKKQAFCGACGAPAPERPPKKAFPIKIVLCIALALSVVANIVLLLSPSLFAQQTPPPQLDGGDSSAPEATPHLLEGDGFSSPEAAIIAYVEAFKSGDVDKMISTYAVESYVECFDLEDFWRKTLTFYQTGAGVILPNNGTYKPQLNKYSRLSILNSEMRYGYFALIGFDASKPVRIYRDTQEEQIADLMTELTASGFEEKLSRIKIGKILTTSDFNYNKEAYDGVLQSYSYLKFDDLQDIAIEIEFDGEEYYLFMLTAKINGKWYNITTASPLAFSQGLDSLSGGILKRG